MASITSANAVLMLAISSLFDIPQQVQQFAAEDIFDNEAIEPAEIMMGVDGKLSAGKVNVPIPWTLSLMADSPSNTLFEAWYASQQATQDVYFANGVITLDSIGRAFTLVNGVLTSYQAMPDAKKVLQPRKFRITWESVIAVPV